MTPCKKVPFSVGQWLVFGFYTYWNNRQEIEEEVMDIFVHLWQHPEKINPDLSIKAYLFQSAYNRCLELIRRESNPTLSLDEVEDMAGSEDEPSRIEMEELNRLIRRAILAIPESSRRIFLMSRDQNLSY